MNNSSVIDALAALSHSSSQEPQLARSECKQKSSSRCDAANQETASVVAVKKKIKSSQLKHRATPILMKGSFSVSPLLEEQN